MIDIDTMSADREMDALIAEKALGISPRVWLETDCACAYCGQQTRWCETRAWCSQCSEWRYGPYKEYSSEIEPAWEVVEKLLETFRAVRVHSLRINQEVTKWLVSVSPKPWSSRGTMDDGDEEASAAFAPLAICRAALLAVEAKND